MPKTEERLATGVEPLLSVDDLAACLKVHRNTIYRWIRQSHFPQPIRCGRGLRWSAHVVRDWIAEQGGE